MQIILLPDVRGAESAATDMTDNKYKSGQHISSIISVCRLFLW
jgi:hypothetical protein